MARQRDGQVNVVGVASRDSVAAMADFVERHDLGHVAHAADEDRTVWSHFGVSYQPAWVFVGPDGTVLDREFGPLYDDALDERITEVFGLDG